MSSGGKNDSREAEMIVANLTPIPKSWYWTMIANVASLITKGSSPGWQGFQYQENGIRFIRSQNVRWGFLDLHETIFLPNDFNKSHQNSIIKCGDVLLNLVGASVGRCAIATAEIDGANLNQAVAIIRLVPNLLQNKLVMYFLLSPQIQAHISTTKADVARANFNLDDVRPTRIPLPPLNEQGRIVAKIEELFSDLDAGVAALKRIKANLKRYRAAVLKAAVEGRLTEAWRAKQGKTEPASKLLERILAERRKKWEEGQLAKFASSEREPPKGWLEKYVEPTPPDTTGLPELPEGWCWASVEQLGHTSLGKMLDKQKHQTGHKLPYLRNVNVRWGNVVCNDLSEMYFEENELNRFGLQAGDLLVCEGGEPGRAAVWNGRLPRIKFQKALHRVRFYSGLEPSYLVYLLEFYAKSGRLEPYFTGSTIKHFTRESFVLLPVPLPPASEQEQISAEVERAISIVAAADSQIQSNLLRASRLRKSILKRAFEGNLVPQDPSDEPAGVLLERLRGSAGKMNGAPGSVRTRNRRHSSTK